MSSFDGMQKLKRDIGNIIDEAKFKLQTLSHEIWSCPELAYKEKQSHDTLALFFSSESGWIVESHFILETAFRATWGPFGGKEGDIVVNIGFLCEYDALPVIGHACGHNLIAEVGAAASIGLKGALEREPNCPVRVKVTVLGTPAEEDGGGKVDLILAGEFKDMDVVFMAHPAQEDLSFSPCIAITDCTVKYHGKASHAAAYPWEGINALDAAVLAYNNLAVLRQQLRPEWRLHVHIVGLSGKSRPSSSGQFDFASEVGLANFAKKFISAFSGSLGPIGNWLLATWRAIGGFKITTSTNKSESKERSTAKLYTALAAVLDDFKGIIKHGGEKPNIIPDYTELEFYLRTPVFKDLSELKAKAEACFRSAALATGCQVEITYPNHSFSNILQNTTLENLYKENGKALGMEFKEVPNHFVGSTDFGNVSFVVPGIHPFFYIGSQALNHTAQYTEAAGAEKAQLYALRTANALAMTAVDVLFRPDLLKRVKEEFTQAKLKQE